VKTTLLVLGVLALIAGLFWAGQGAGFIQWPTPQPGQFTMVGHSNWVFIGLGVAIAGLGLVLLSRRQA
jgi:LPXTG-motif cell wall-anchored protein